MTYREREIFSFDDILEKDRKDFGEYHYSFDCYVNLINREYKFKKKFLKIPTKIFYCLDTKGEHSYNRNFVFCPEAFSNFRTITDKEGARLQGFKDYAFVENGVDKFSFDPTLSKAEKNFLLGNSVTIPVIEEIGKFIVKELKRLDESD